MDGSNPIKVTREGDHDVINLPPDIAVPLNAVVRQEGDRLIIESGESSSRKQRLLNLLATLEATDEDIGPIDDPLPRPVNL